jgi:hypothetical protein
MLILPRKSRVLPPATFIRTSTAYDSLGRLIAAGRARIERIAGQWGVLVEEGTANLFDGQLESGNIDTSGVPYASASVIRTKNFQAVNASTQYSLSNSAGYPIARLCAYDTSYVFISTIGGTTFTTPANCRYLKWALVGTVITTRAQLEAKPYSTSFHDTTRAAETIAMPGSLFNAAEGSMSWRFRLSRAPGSNEQFLFDGGGALNQNLQVVVKTDGKPCIRYGTGAATVEAASASAIVKDTDYEAEWRWSATGAALLINGVPVASDTTVPSLAFGANAYLASRADGTLQLDGYVGQGIAWNVAKDDAALLASYQQGGIADIDTTLIWRPGRPRKLIL